MARDAEMQDGEKIGVLDIGREAETFGGIVVGKLKLVAMPIDDEEAAFRYTKPRVPRMGRSHVDRPRNRCILV